jgi:putative transcriptional regulator
MMAKKAFTKIMAGLQDAADHLSGKKTSVVVHTVRVPGEIDVRAVRARLKLSQAKFAARFGLDIRALQDWEQHRRNPDRATRVLLTVIDKNPKAVERALADAEE